MSKYQSDGLKALCCRMITAAFESSGGGGAPHGMGVFPLHHRDGQPGWCDVIVKYEALFGLIFTTHAKAVEQRYAPTLADAGAFAAATEASTDYLFTCYTRAVLRAASARGVRAYAYAFAHAPSAGARVTSTDKPACLRVPCHASDNVFHFGTADRVAKIWNVATGECVHTLRNRGRCQACGFSSDGAFLLLGFLFHLSKIKKQSTFLTFSLLFDII